MTWGRQRKKNKISIWALPIFPSPTISIMAICTKTSDLERAFCGSSKLVTEDYPWQDASVEVLKFWKWTNNWAQWFLALKTLSYITTYSFEVVKRLPATKQYCRDFTVLNQTIPSGVMGKWEHWASDTFTLPFSHTKIVLCFLLLTFKRLVGHKGSAIASRRKFFPEALPQSGCIICIIITIVFITVKNVLLPF